MIALDAERSLRIDVRSATRIVCESGVLWVTQAGDLRDFFLGRGDLLVLGAGVTIATALERSVVSVSPQPAASWIERLIAGVRLRSTRRPIRIQWSAGGRERMHAAHALAPSIEASVDAHRDKSCAASPASQSSLGAPRTAQLVAAGGSAGGAG